MTTLTEDKHRNPIRWLAMDWIVLTVGVVMLSSAILGTVLNIAPQTTQNDAPAAAPGDIAPL